MLDILHFLGFFVVFTMVFPYVLMLLVVLGTLITMFVTKIINYPIQLFNRVIKGEDNE